MNRKHILSLLAATLLTATVSLLTACGSDDDDTTVPHITPESLLMTAIALPITMSPTAASTGQ